ncbi:MAG: hydrogenase 4 subunit B [Candidatus Melainabacteria bacterium]|nr:hydrogenase 4 subunit B [Candidatus Melainabacteria bacterium]
MNETQLLQFSFLFFILATISSFLLNNFSKKLSIFSSTIFGIIASALCLLSSALILIHRSKFIFNIPFGLPFGRLELLIDPLAAFFLMLISMLSIPVLIYSVGYLQAEYIEKNVGVLCALYHLFVLSMLLVVCAANGFLFLFLWESMTLISFALVIFDTNKAESKNAGFIYLLMTHIGSAFILFIFLILAKYTGSFSFASFHNIGHQLPGALKLILFIFVLIGFGTKAGLIPLHIWLPEAHPAAPSHISALMSGVMIKTAVYGILRFVFDFLSPFPYWWGLILAGISILTAILGMIYASGEVDIKRMLAFSSIENMGIILLPIGIGMVFFSLGQKELAGISIIAGLLHTINHSLFKGLLFMCAGSVISVTHTRNMEKMGGLIKLMPQTSFFFLIGALAISAFPPFNGFISEWLIFQTLLSSFHIHSQAMKIFSPICAALLGFTGAICAATFVKAFSGIFLAMPRSHTALHAHNVSYSMRLGMRILAFLCLCLGVIPFFGLTLLENVSESIVSAKIKSNLFNVNKLFVNFGPDGFAYLSPALVFLLMTLLLLLVYFFFKFNTSMSFRKEETWSCGVTPKPEYEYTPSGYSQPLKIVFSEMHTPESFYHKYIYLPLVNGLIGFSHKVRPMQSGILQVYLFYIFITLILCLVWLRL